MSFITAISTAVPEYKFEQSVIADFMERLVADGEPRRKIKTVFRASGIKTRHSVLSDYGKTTGFTFFPNTPNLDPFPGTEQRMVAYREYAIDLSVAAVHNIQTERQFDYSSITHLITVSCTGMYAPGLDIDLVKRLPLRSSVHRTCINFMGCFAAINALKSADAFCKADPKAKVLIVCTELCSLHFQKDFTDDTILANALFADGSAAMLVEPDSSGLRLRLDGFYSDIAHHGADAMAWSIGDLGFEMKLSSYVPEILRSGIQGLMNGLMSRTGLSQDQINHFAVHPGGKKILDVVAEALTISPERLSSGYQVLHDYGNMSSPTIVFVLKAMLDGKMIQKEDSIMAMAFGPGLTMESALIKCV
jgi:prepilin-type processing-associated H-X9-DG protein